MKNLLQKSLRPLTVFAFVVFALSIPSYFLLVDWMWMKELDENNELIAERIENEFNEQKISDDKLEENIKFWNSIQPVSKIEYTGEHLDDETRYTVRRQNPYSEDEVIDRFRGLKKEIEINDREFLLTIETNVEETEETVVYIAIMTLVFFLILVIGFWVMNRRLSKKLWLPFQDTLEKIKNFELNSEKPVQFQETDTTEFAELNATVDKLLRQSIATYKNQKEFTENASHEMQTPLAVLKNKIDLLLQTDGLTKKQYEIAEEMNEALMRSSALNKNLLLLAKIENSQFDSSEVINFSTILLQSIEEFHEHFVAKNIRINQNILPDIVKKGNTGLTEILINNLIINSIRYASNGSEITVSLSDSSFQIGNSGDQALDSELLFKRFSKISSAGKGSGLGLSIVQEIAKLHGWKVNYSFRDGSHIFSVLF